MRYTQSNVFISSLFVHYTALLKMTKRMKRRLTHEKRLQKLLAYLAKLPP